METAKIVIRVGLVVLALWGVKKIFIDGRPRKAIRDGARRRSLPDVPAPEEIFESGSSSSQAVRVIDDHHWNDELADQALLEVLSDPEAKIRSSLDLAYLVADRMWPRSSVRPGAMSRVRQYLQEQLSFDDAIGDADAHEAAVVIAARSRLFIEDVCRSRDDDPSEPIAIELAKRLFPSLGWESPQVEWQPAALDKLSQIVDAYRSGGAREVTA